MRIWVEVIALMLYGSLGACSSRTANDGDQEVARTITGGDAPNDPQEFSTETSQEEHYKEGRTSCALNKSLRARDAVLAQREELHRQCEELRSNKNLQEILSTRLRCFAPGWAGRIREMSKNSSTLTGYMRRVYAASDPKVWEKERARDVCLPEIETVKENFRKFLEAAVHQRPNAAMGYAAELASCHDTMSHTLRAFGLDLGECPFWGAVREDMSRIEREYLALKPGKLLYEAYIRAVYNLKFAERGEVEMDMNELRRLVSKYGDGSSIASLAFEQHRDFEEELTRTGAVTSLTIKELEECHSERFCTIVSLQQQSFMKNSKLFRFFWNIDAMLKSFDSTAERERAEEELEAMVAAEDSR